MATTTCREGHDNPAATRFCVECGEAMSVATIVSPPVPVPPPTYVAATPDRRASKVWRNVAIGIATVVAVVLVVEVTAERWTKVVIPEKPTTYRIETYLTGDYDVYADQADPCWVGQDWTDCTNVMIDQYNWACVGIALTDVGYSVCERYSDEIDWMIEQDGPWIEVASLGGMGGLSRQAESATRRVSNNDYRPAVTREAVCYVGFLGECQ